MEARIYFGLILILGLFLTTSDQTQAQSLVGAFENNESNVEALLDEPLSREAVTELMSGLTDEQIRSILLERLSSEAEARALTVSEEKAVLDVVFGYVWTTVSRLWEPFVRTALYPEAFSGFYQTMSKGEEGYGASLIFAACLSILVGFVCVLILSLLLRGWRQRNNDANPSELYGKIAILLGRAGLDGALLIAFALGAISFAQYWQTDEAGQATLNLFMDETVGVAFAILAGRFILAPYRPDLRLLSCSDEAARFLFWSIIIVSAVSMYGGVILEWTYLMGAKPGELLFGFWIQAAQSIMLAYAIWHARAGIAEMIIGNEKEPVGFLVFFAHLWPILLMVAVVMVWIAVEAYVANGLLELLPRDADSDTLILLVLIPAFETMIRAFAWHYFPDIQETDQDRPGTADARKATRKIIVRFARVILCATFVIMLPGIWGLDLLSGDTASGATSFIYHVIDVLLTVLVAYSLLQVFDLYYERQMAFENGLKPKQDEEELGGEGGSGGGTRLSTILPIIRWTVLIAISMVTVFTSMQQLGISVAPILAGAGILSLAIGFGAQTLVKDIVSGVFFLIDDAFRMGEYIEIEGTIGTVEKISARSLGLRHHKGAVHTIPYGEIPKLTNYSRDWVIMKLRFRVPFDTDMNKVKKIFKKIGAELMNHPLIGEDFIQPFKSQGVIELDDSGMVVRGKFMTKPGKQFTARKEIFNQVQKAFAENGIQFARREVRVHIPGVEEEGDGVTHLNDDQKRAVAAAAQNAISQSEQSTPPKIT